MLIILKMWWPLLLFPLPWIFRLLMKRAANMDSGLLRVPFFAAINDMASRRERNPGSLSRGMRLLLLLIWTLLVIAAAGPLYIGDPITIRQKARDLMLAVDVSGSMVYQDMRVKGEQADRLTAVKHVLHDFIQRRNGDRLGLILFGSQAYLQTPLTFDHVTLRQLLDESQIGIAGKATAIGDAIGLALKRLQDRPSESKVMVLLTDGANTAGEVSPLQAAELAAQKGLKIYTIAMGADEIVVPGILGTNLGARRINPSADLDEATMMKIAELTGGQYFRAKSTESLRQIYELLDALEPVEADPEIFRPIRALYYYPLGLALLLSMAIVLRQIIRNTLLHRALQQREAALAPGEAAP